LEGKNTDPGGNGCRIMATRSLIASGFCQMAAKNCYFGEKTPNFKVALVPKAAFLLLATCSHPV